MGQDIVDSGVEIIVMFLVKGYVAKRVGKETVKVALSEKMKKRVVLPAFQFGGLGKIKRDIEERAKLTKLVIALAEVMGEGVGSAGRDIGIARKVKIWNEKS
jgi:hypothetical protein